MKTTLKAIRAHSPCSEGWTKLLRTLNKTTANDAPLSIVQVLDSNGLDDTLWCLRAVDGRDREIRLYAVWCARQVQHLMMDQRSTEALDVAERHAWGLATAAELAVAEDAAWDVARAAAGNAAWAAAWAAAGNAAGAAAGNAAWAAAWAAAGAAQCAELRRVCTAIDAGELPYAMPVCANKPASEVA